MDLKHLTDSELHTATLESNEKIRNETTVLLHHLREIERRKLFATFACPSLFQYCVDILKMSEHQAARRVNAARLLAEVPEIEEKINSGSLTLSAVAQAQTFVRQEKKAGNILSKTEKLDLLTKLEEKSVREVEKILIFESSRPFAPVKESVRQVTVEIAKLKIPVDTELMANLDRLKEVWSHSIPGASYTDIIKRAAELCVKQHDPLEKAKRYFARQEKKSARELQQH